MKKTAVVYDKWLSTLGGGEVVACNFARALADAGYQTTFACGQLIDPKIIKDKLKIDLSDLKFVEVWNDENKLKDITKGNDIFVNASYMDYMLGAAKKNYYYTSFPTDPSSNLKSTVLNKLILPIFSGYLKPVEFITPPKMIKRRGNNLLYLLDQDTKLAFSFLKINQPYKMKFFLFLENFSKSELDSIDFSLKEAGVTNQTVTVDHFNNVIKFVIDFVPTQTTIYLNLHLQPLSDSIFLINPQINNQQFLNKYFSSIKEKIDSRLRAGFFGNVSDRMKRYQQIFANSHYTQKWIKKYWGCNSTVLYPPVDLIKPDNSINKINRICSVGRFFTLGHGKKQEIMIEAFKQLYDQGFKDWELHLAGGLGNEPTSVEFMEHLKKSAAGYPIFFHINCSRKEIEELYLSSKIYWHAAGFGENKDKNPIKFEHFGIAPIEAMSANCTPILYNGGGLSEVITLLNLDPQIHLFNTIDELVQNTQKVISNSISLPSNTNQQLESLFGLKHFQKQFKKKILELK